MKAKVYLVGAGPGDPGLITVKGRECIQNADVIIYDYLASPVLLNDARQSAELIYVGKKGGDHTLSQHEINKLIVEKVKSGAMVCRLKGGDPFIFGRGGEEAEVLSKAGLPFEIVPGVTSAIAAAAYAGIPLTHRKLASTLAFVTGHEDPEKETTSINWSSLANGIGTLVFFMGVKNLPHITRNLMDHGKSPATPVALIQWGTTASQKTATGTLETIVARAKAAGIKAPAIIVVGDVVKLRKKLQWFEKRPLLGKRIVVTRARQQASNLVGLLGDLGAECLEHPTIKIMPASDRQPLKHAVENLAVYDWIVFTSVNGVLYFFEQLFSAGKDVRALGRMKTAAIGPATAGKLREFGLTSDLVPKSYRAESVVEAFKGEHLQDKRILLPRAAEARPVLPAELQKMGARVEEIPAYETLKANEGASDLVQQLEDRRIDLITFTSSSTVKNFKALLPSENFKELLQGVTVASIGPITSDTAAALGFEVHITAESYTIPGLVEAIVQYFQKDESSAHTYRR
jgi:uroporphyrinogen III methyltransferase/synthase